MFACDLMMMLSQFYHSGTISMNKAKARQEQTLTHRVFRWVGAIIVVVASASTAARADDTAELKASNAKLQSQNEALKENVEQLSDRLAKLEADVRKLRLQYAQDLRSLTDRMAKLDNSRPSLAKVDPTPTLPVKPGTGHGSGTNVVNPVKPVGPITLRPPTRIPDPVIPKPRIRPKHTGDRPKGLPTTMAVVDMVSLFKALQEKDSIEFGLKELVYAVGFENKAWRTKLNNLSADIQLLGKGTPAHQYKSLEIEKARIGWQIAIETAKRRLDRRRGDLTGVLYAKMVEAVGRVADDNGYEVVLFKEPTPVYTDYRSVGDFLASRMVVQANDSVDLTDQVIRVMNREYNSTRDARDALR
jgi:Skp family chaperone for outer membrane proteins